MIRQMVAALLAAASWAPAVQAQDAQQDGGRYGGRGMARPDRGDRQAGRPERQQQAPQQQAQQPQPPAYQPPAPVQPTQQRGDWRQRGQAQQRVDGQAQGQVQAQPQFQPRADRGLRDGDRRFDGRRDGDRRFDGQPRPGQPRADGQGRTGNDARALGDRRPDFRGDGRNNGYRDGGRNGYGVSIGTGNRGTANWGYDARGGRADWNRSWRGDGRYDWNRYRQSNRSAFRLPRYYAPSNWNYGYRRFSIGVTLSSLLWGQNYWIEEPDFYRLPPAYGPYRWVRYYNDALLVDIRSGYVVDTVYDIFW